jgi:hypothetical protein
MIIDPNRLPDRDDMYGPEPPKRRGLPLPLAVALALAIVTGVAILVRTVF